MGLGKKLYRLLFMFWFAFVQTMIAVPVVYSQNTDSKVIDVEPPLIEHELVSPVDADIRQAFVATVVDDDELHNVRLFYRFKGEPTYSSLKMYRVSYSASYTAQVPTDPDTGGTIEYYIQAIDVSGNRTVRGYAFNPLVRQVVPPTAASTELGEIPGEDSGSSATGLSVGKKTLFVALGVLVAGLLASAAGGGSSVNEDCPNDRCDINITIGNPVLTP